MNATVQIRFLQSLLRPVFMAVAMTTLLILAVDPRPLTAVESGPFPVYRSFDDMAKAVNPVVPPVRCVTRGPRQHWFGYYDKAQLDHGNRYLLCNEVDFDRRFPGRPGCDGLLRAK